MAIAHLNENNFDTETSQGTCLVDFWATWCGPCRMQAPVLEKLDAELQGSVKICKVDVHENPRPAQRLGLGTTPTPAAIRAAGVDTFMGSEKKVLPALFGGLENWFFTGPSGEQIELLRML